MNFALRTGARVVCGILLLCFPLIAQEAGESIHYQLGMKYQNENKADQAIEEYNKVLAEYPDHYNTYFHLAEIRMVQKQFRLAIFNLRKALSYNPGWGKAQRMLASALAEDGQFQKAIMELQFYQQSCDPAERLAVQSSIDSLLVKVKAFSGREEPVVAPANSTAVVIPGKKKSTTASVAASAAKSKTDEFFNHGVVLYEQQRFEDALEMMKRTLTQSPGHAGAYYYGGLIRLQKGQVDLAKINFTKAFNYPRLGVNAHFFLGKILANEKNCAEAVKELTAFMKLSADTAGKLKARAILASCEAQSAGVKTKPLPLHEKADLSDWDVGTVDTVVVHVPDTVIPEIYGTMEVRIDALLSLMVTDTMTGPGRVMLGGVHEFAGHKFDRAINEFKKTLVAYPRGDIAAQCLYNIGVCYMKLRLYANAENQFQQLISRFPQHELAAQAMFLKAVALGERKEVKIAEKLMREFIQKYRTHVWIGKAYEKLGDLYIDIEQSAKAVDAFGQAAALASVPSDKVCALYKQAEAYFKIGNPLRAVGSLRQTIETGKKNKVVQRIPDAYYKIADYYYQQKNYAEALENYTTVTNAFPGFSETPWGVFQIANIYKQKKEFRNAVDTYKLLIARYPDDYWARQARWKIDDAIWDDHYQSVLK